MGEQILSLVFFECLKRDQSTHEVFLRVRLLSSMKFNGINFYKGVVLGMTIVALHSKIFAANATP